jgi:hypothetical protein
VPRAEAQQTEDWVVRHLVKGAEDMGCICKRNVTMGGVRRGWPDWTFYWFEGVTDVIETKRPKNGKYEPLQLRTHARLRERGHSMLVIRTKDAVDAYLESRLPYARPSTLKKSKP